MFACIGWATLPRLCNQGELTTLTFIPAVADLFADLFITGSAFGFLLASVSAGLYRPGIYKEKKDKTFGVLQSQTDFV